MSIRAIIFDGDGVSIHPWRFSNYLIEECSISAETTEGFFRGPFLDCMRGMLDLKEALDPLLEPWGWHKGYDCFLEEWLTRENAPKHEVLSLVTSLRERGYRCYLGSNQDKSRARYIEKEMKFNDQFDHCFFSCDLGAIKPEQEYFKAITTVLELSPEDIIFFDDSPGHVAAASRFGWRAFEATEKDQMLSFLNSQGV